VWNGTDPVKPDALNVLLSIADGASYAGFRDD
jgi:hypothetical protein